MDKCKGSSDGWNRDATCLRYGAPNGTVVCFWCGRHLEILKSGKITLGKQKLAIGSMGRVN